MKDEIKEILKDIKQWVDNPLDEVDKKYGIGELSYNQSKLLLDYITNLQEENNNLKEDFKRHIDRINELTERSNNLQEELKSANESITWWHNRFNAKNNGFKSTIEELCETTEKFEKLQEENDILKRDIEAMKHNYNLLVKCIENGESMTQKFENGLTYQDYKSRNEKAIEYNNHLMEHAKYHLNLGHLKKMDKILKGVDTNE